MAGFNFRCIHRQQAGEQHSLCRVCFTPQMTQTFTVLITTLNDTLLNLGTRIR